MLKSRLNALNPPVNNIDGVTEEKLEDAKKRTRQKYITMSFIITVDCNCYIKLLEDLENQHTQGYHKLLSTNIIEEYMILTHRH